MKKFAPIIAAVLLIGGYFGYTKFMAGASGPKETPAQAQATQRTKDAADKRERLRAPIDGPLTGIGDPFVITLPDTAAPHFAKFAIALKVDKGTPFEAAAGEAKGALALVEKPEIRDIVIRVFGSRTYADLLDGEKRAQVKAELKQTITKETAHTIVLNVFFTDFALQ